MTPSLATWLVALSLGAGVQAGAREVVAEIRVHGNHLTTDADLIGLSGLSIGDPFDDTTIDTVTKRLRDTGRFDDVDVRKRFASIADPTQIVVVIVVNEGPVRVVRPSGPGEAIRVVPRRGLRNLMYMPILDAEDGYGLTYGARVAYVGLAGDMSRLSFPLTWGGLKQAGVEFDRVFESGPFSRLAVGGAVQRQANPHYDEDDNRRRLWVRGERQLGVARIGGGAGWQHVTFLDSDARLRTTSLDVIVDTRLNPVQPRDAVYARVAVERFDGLDGGGLAVISADARGYLGLFGQTVLEGRVARVDGTAPLPPYLKPLLGGWSSLRGFEAGAFAGDTRVTGSLELHVPLNSPLSVGRLGISAFVDAGLVHDHGERARDAPVRVGGGGSAWFALSAFKMSLSVARGRGAGTRVNFGGGFAF